jgi:serine/threonine protein kinase
VKNIGRYQVLREIGKGAMGHVYLAYDPYLNMQVAIKTLPQNIPADEIQPEVYRRFINEAHYLAKINHPHVVRIFDVCPDDKNPYISMEYVDGSELTVLFEGNREIDLKKSLRIMIQICQGLHAIHAANLIHRDLKPANIMIDSNENIKIMDFGIVKDQSSQQHLTKNLTGSPCSMSPEQIRGDTLDLRSDIFSLGIIFYQLLTGTHPFLGNTLGQTFSNISYLEPLPPSQINKKLPSTVDRIILKCLKKTASDRYSNSLFLEQELRNVQPSDYKKSQSDRSSKGVLALSTLVFLISAAYFSLFHWNPTKNRGPANNSSNIQSHQPNPVRNPPKKSGPMQIKKNQPTRISYVDLLEKCQDYPCNKLDSPCAGLNAKTKAGEQKSNLSVCLQAIGDRLKKISAEYPSVSCGDSTCTFLEKRCGICTEDCGHVDFHPNLPACINLHIPEPHAQTSTPHHQEQIHAARIIYDDCYFRLNSKELTTPTFAKSQTECLLLKKNAIIEECSKFINGKNNADLSRKARFLSCIVNGGQIKILNKNEQ